jgi:hypothetical protein
VIALAPSLKAIGGAHTGIAPVSLLDVLDTNGNAYYWSDRVTSAPNVITSLSANLTPPRAIAPNEGVTYISGPSMSVGGATGPYGAYNGTASTSVMPFSIPNDAVITGLYCGVIGSGSGMGNGGWIVKFPGGSGEGGYFSGSLWGPSLVGNFGAATGENAKTYIEGMSWGLTGGCGDIGSSASVSAAFFPMVTVYYTMPGGEPLPTPSVLSIFAGPYLPWILEVPEFKTYRSLQTDTGSFVLQNLSGDTLSRDFEKIMRRSALEGALFVYRLWQADAQASWLEVHGTLTVTDVGVDTVKLKGVQLLNPAQDDTPLEQYCETCQLQWGGPRCGATGSTECSYSLQTCQSPNRIMVEQNHFEKNYGEATANTAFNVINRRRAI